MFLDVFSVKNISDYYVLEIPTIAYKTVAMDEKMEFFQDISHADFTTHSGVPGGGGVHQDLKVRNGWAPLCGAIAHI